MSDCVICQKHDNLEIEYVLFQNENWIIIHGPIEANILGYFYLEPRRHVENWSDLKDEELQEAGLLIKKVEMTVRKLLPVERLYAVTISEAVRHLHIHLIPRMIEAETKGLSLISQATAPTGNETDLSSEDLQIFIHNLQKTIKTV